MRRSLPSMLMSSGTRDPFGRSKSSAGPPARVTRSVISVISSTGSTSAVDALQFAFFFQARDELAQVLIGHAILLDLPRAQTALSARTTWRKNRRTG